MALCAGGESAVPLAERLIAKLTTIPLTITNLRRAGILPPPDLRPLDSIHLATTLSLDEVVAEFACHDAAWRMGPSALDFRS